MVSQLYNNVSLASYQIYNFAKENPIQVTTIVAQNVLPLVATYFACQGAQPGWSTFAKCEVLCASTESLFGGAPALCAPFCWSLSSNYTATP